MSGRSIANISLVSLAWLAAATAFPQAAYKHRDANGQWVFTDQAATVAAPGESLALTRGEETPLRIAVERVRNGAGAQLLAINDCLCVVTFRLDIRDSDVKSLPAGTQFSTTVQPRSRQPIVQFTEAAAGSASLRYQWRAALGTPDAVHNPGRPYRVPFAVGATHMVSQAYPTRITHTTPDSQYAIDIALPDGTPVYAAREGTVINVRHNSFRGSADPAMLDQANVVEILHEDGTIAIYGHLHWDSIRVRIGQQVSRGEYLANSGNTGFSSGPHLHFGVVRNAGGEEIAVPVQFAGPGGAAVTPQTRAPLTAY